MTKKPDMNHYYLVSMIGDNRAFEALVTTSNMYCSGADLTQARQFISNTHENVPYESLVISCVSYLGYMSPEEFGIQEVENGG